jgi:hypothetical protein
MRNWPLIESAATVENMDLIRSTLGLANRVISPLRCSVLSDRDAERHMIKAFCCLTNLVVNEWLSAWHWVKRQSCRSDRTIDLISHYAFFSLSRQTPDGSYGTYKCSRPIIYWNSAQGTSPKSSILPTMWRNKHQSCGINKETSKVSK